MTTAQFPNGPTSDPLGGTSSQDAGAKEQAQQVAATAADEGRHVAGTAKEEATKVASEAKSQAQTLLSDATSQVDEQSRAQKDRLAETMRTFSDDLDSMSAQGSGLAAEVAGQVAQRARSLSEQLETKEPRDLLDDVRDFARRRPGTFLLGALAAGVVAGRFTRGAKEAQSGSVGSGTSGTTSGQGTSARPAGYAGSATAPTYGSPGVAAPTEPTTSTATPQATPPVSTSPADALGTDPLLGGRP